MRTTSWVCALLVLSALGARTVHASWMVFSASSISSATGTWPGGSALSGTAAVTASNFVNGNNATGPIGLTPITIPNLSADYNATGLVPNPGPVVTEIATPYNDSADTYHVVIDFTGTTGGSTPGTLPAGSVFAIIDLDITENYKNIRATNVSNAPITSAWIFGPYGYFDMDNPMTPAGLLTPPPTFSGAGGVYQMLGPSYNFDVEMWLFKTTQDVKTISFDMDKSTGGNAIGGGGAGWAFYTKAGTTVPEPTVVAIVFGGLALSICRVRRHRRNC